MKWVGVGTMSKTCTESGHPNPSQKTGLVEEDGQRRRQVEDGSLLAITFMHVARSLMINSSCRKMTCEHFIVNKTTKQYNLTKAQ